MQRSNRLPRMWWCPTGRFAFLPIHAAGIYEKDKGECLSDYVISSYTPTLAALLGRPLAATSGTSFKMTTIIVPNAPQCSPLPGTSEELAQIEEVIPTQWITTLNSPNGSDVTAHLKQSAIVHFACHGVQDSKSPLDSGLMLADGRLKLSTIMRQHNDDADALDA